jgi:hypothetical protein
LTEEPGNQFHQKVIYNSSLETKQVGCVSRADSSISELS